NILQKFRRIDINEQIKDTAIQFRIDYKLKTPDAIIAASSHNLKIPLFTADRKLSKIEDILFIFFESKLS
ncbi:MAG TPA: PIN domain-containing protein, partial [Puia sp.]|nr:PIN domain-containing protein [Puia sp.]